MNIYYLFALFSLESFAEVPNNEPLLLAEENKTLEENKNNSNNSIKDTKSVSGGTNIEGLSPTDNGMIQLMLQS